ncbi:MAG: type 4a pilus biogenesis protein PilO [Betaproteobacteria bacterium]|nr:type 4a pilus biogenesis protein PilO [Betaproteobacteria bacterium]
MSKQLNFKQIADDFSSLKSKDPGVWLPIPRYFMLFVFCVAVVGLGCAALWYGQWEELEAAAAEEQRLRGEWLESKKAAASLELYRLQLAEIDRSFGALLKQLPNRSEVENLLIEVNQAGMGRGLQFELFKPEAEQIKDFYAELPISVKVIGSYDDLGAFATDIARLPRIVTLNDIDLAKEPKSGQLTMSMKLKTFRYLDADEMTPKTPPQGGRI